MLQEVRKELTEVRAEADEEQKRALVAAREAAHKIEVRKRYSLLLLQY